MGLSEPHGPHGAGKGEEKKKTRLERATIGLLQCPELDTYESGSVVWSEVEQCRDKYYYVAPCTGDSKIGVTPASVSGAPQRGVRGRSPRAPGSLPPCGEAATWLIRGWRARSPADARKRLIAGHVFLHGVGYWNTLRPEWAFRELLVPQESLRIATWRCPALSLPWRRVADAQREVFRGAELPKSLSGKSITPSELPECILEPGWRF